LSVTLENPKHPKRNVVGLSDPSFSNAFDDLLNAATDSASELMQIAFVESDMSPLSGQVATLGFAAGLFVHFYNEFRNEGYSIELAFEAAKVQTLSHPVIQEALAKAVTTQVNRSVVQSE
tara:strand:- start:6748 stop:7107 length:360 start_codon:yes stop_codon:yes gene_type:complete